MKSGRGSGARACKGPAPLSALVCAFLCTACTGNADEAGHAGRSAGGFFTDVTEAAGLSPFRHVTGARGDIWFPETMGAGVAVLDYDGDGYPDILAVRGATWESGSSPDALALYRNRGDGTFRDVTSEAGLSGIVRYGMGVTAADYDNDGDVDVYLTAVGPNLLLRNEGGIFVDATETAGVAGNGAWSTSTLFFDADGDGWLDLFVGNYVHWSPEDEIPCPRENGELAYCTPEMYVGLPPHLFMNRGDGTFADESAASGFAASAGKTLGVAMADVDGDGRVDIILANDTEADELFLNRGGGEFVEAGLRSGMAFDEQGKARAGMGIDVGDVDGDGRVSVLVGNFASEMISFFTPTEDGLFVDRAARSGIGRPSLATLTFGLLLLDVDLDGDLDLVAFNGHIDPDVGRYRDNISYRQTPQLFLNGGDGSFALVVPAPNDALAKPLVARGAAYGDFDRDGDLDVVVTENAGSLRLWRNETRNADSAGPSFARVVLRSMTLNRDAIGATVALYSEGRLQLRQVRTGGSYLSVSEQALTFGLGDAGEVDSMIVTWPDGTVEHHGAAPADREIEFTRNS